MTPVSFPQVNALLNAPVGQPDVAQLPVARTCHDDGTPAIISCFELSDDELADLVKTKRLWVGIMGHSMPPIALLTKSPFVEAPNEKVVDTE